MPVPLSKAFPSSLEGAGVSICWARKVDAQAHLTRSSIGVCNAGLAASSRHENLSSEHSACRPRFEFRGLIRHSLCDSFNRPRRGAPQERCNKVQIGFCACFPGKTLSLYNALGAQILCRDWPLIGRCGQASRAGILDRRAARPRRRLPAGSPHWRQRQDSPRPWPQGLVVRTSR
jgi:hypothetical protein